MTDSLLLPRRQFLKTAIAATALGTLAAAQPPAPIPAPDSVIDVNVDLGRWPLRRLPAEDPAVLAKILKSHGVVTAWAGAFDGLLHKDIAAANHRLTGDCRNDGHGFFRPFGSVNLALPDWQEDLRRCAEIHRMPGIRLHPNYHGYTLADPNFHRLLQLAAEHRLLVQLALTMEDERIMHPLFRVPPVDITPLVDLLPQYPKLPVVILNALGSLHGPALHRLVRAGNVYVEISMLEGMAGLEKLLAEIPLDRVLFGSHAPLFYFESAALKLKESLLDPKQRRAIQSGNARRLLS